MQNLNILIADDEAAARSSLRNLSWSAHGCTLVGEAEDGQQVLELMASLPVDVVLLDIGMPVLSGLQLMPIIAEKYPDVKVIFLTMYRDFDYALEAMRFKVFDYLIKDVFNSEHLFDCIERVRLASHAEFSLHEKAREGELRALVRQLEQSPMPTSRPVRLLRLFRGEGQSDGFWMARIEQRIMSLPGCAGCVPVSENDWLIFGLEDDRALLEGLDDRWSNSYQVTSALEGCDTVAKAAQKGGAYLDGGFYHPTCRLLSDGDYCEKMPDKAAADFVAEIRACFGRLTNDDDVLMQWIARCEALRVAPYEIKRLLISAIPVHVSNQIDPSPLIAALWHANTSSEAVALLRGYLLKYRLLSGGRRIEVQRVEAYIQAHLDGDLSVQTLGEQVRLSPNYLSHLFHEQTNESLKGYIMRTRMEAAAQMLKGGSKKINEIAGLVGFPTARYFSDAFCKYYGVTPKEYRRR